MDARSVGELAHRTVAELLAAGERAPTPATLFEVVGRHPLLVDRPRHDKGYAAQTLVGATALYFRFFVPEPKWQYIGSEVSAGPCRLDLVFEDARGRVRADELKSGRIDDAAANRALKTQVTEQLRGGQERWAGKFAGVRVVLLATPRRSWLAGTDGHCEPLTWEVDRNGD